MPKYEVLEKSLIGNELFEAGAIVEYDGYPSGNLKPLDAEGEAKAAELVEINKQRVRDMAEANAVPAAIDAEALGKAIAAAVATALAEQAAEKAAAEQAAADAKATNTKTA